MSAVATSIEFSSIEQLEEVTSALNWPLEYRQLKPGAFCSRFDALDSDTWFLLGEQSSRLVEVEGGSPSDMFVLAVIEGDPVTANGQTMGMNQVYLQSPDSAFRATLPAGLKIIQIGVAIERFLGMIEFLAPGLKLPASGVHLLDSTEARLTSVQRDMRSTQMIPSLRSAIREESVSRILAEFIAIANDQSGISSERDIRAAAARRALDRAREFIETHACEAIRIEAVCSYAGTTLRSLERIFARELGVSPQQYVKARRLNSVRRHLLAAEEDQVLVTDVALSQGFSHMGRFAGDYRRYFGESPRETLQGR